MPDDSAQPPDAPSPDEDLHTAGVPGGAGTEPAAAAADTEDASEPEVDGEPTRFRVANTGWPPPSGSVGPALPRRTPGGSGGPGGPDPSTDDPADEPAGPAAMRSGWVTSPPLDDEPWAGLPPAAREAAAPEPVTHAAPPSAETLGEATPPPDAALPSPETLGEATPPPDAAPPPDAGVEAAVDAKAGPTSGRHRGPTARHGRPRRRGLRRRTSDIPDSAPDTTGTGATGTDSTEADAAALLPPAVGDNDPSANPDAGVGVDDDRDTSDGSDAAPSGPGRSTASRARRRRPRRLAPTWPVARLGLLALAVVAALVFGVLTLVTRVWPGPAGNPYTSSSTKAAIAAATAVAPPILSYNYTTIDKKAAQLAPLQTATCATQYKQLITTTVKPLAVQNKATQQAAVLAAGVTNASKNAVTVLAFMQLTSSNSVKKGKTINEAQISVSMVKQHGRWLLAGTSANGAGNAGNPSCGGANPTGK